MRDAFPEIFAGLFPPFREDKVESSDGEVPAEVAQVSLYSFYITGKASLRGNRFSRHEKKSRNACAPPETGTLTSCHFLNLDRFDNSNDVER